MLHFYAAEQFDSIKFFRLNADQILQFLACPNFVGPMACASPEKVVEAIKSLQTSRQLKLHNRPEIVDAIRSIALDHATLSSFEKQSYVSALMHATAKMKIVDQ